MKALLIISLLGASVFGFSACRAKVDVQGTPVEEKKETIVNPPVEKKVETNTTIVNPPAGDKK